MLGGLRSREPHLAAGSPPLLLASVEDELPPRPELARRLPLMVAFAVGPALNDDEPAALQCIASCADLRIGTVCHLHKLSHRHRQSPCLHAEGVELHGLRREDVEY